MAAGSRRAGEKSDSQFDEHADVVRRNDEALARGASAFFAALRQLRRDRRFFELPLASRGGLAIIPRGLVAGFFTSAAEA
jgi:hypothetical protein